MSQLLSSAAVVIGALRVKILKMLSGRTRHAIGSPKVRLFMSGSCENGTYQTSNKQVFNSLHAISNCSCSDFR